MAGLRLSEFVETVRLACDRSDLVTGYNVRILDNVTVKIRVLLRVKAFIDVYFNPENGNCSFALIKGGKRIYGADNAFIGWHLHPFGSPDQHVPCPELSFDDFLLTVEEWAIRGRSSIYPLP